MLKDKLEYLTRYIITLIIVINSGLTFARDNSKTINFHEIKIYAELSNAAYQSANDINRISQLNNFNLAYFNSIPEIYVSYFLVTNKKTRTQILSIRGTANIENAMVDIALKLVPDNHLGIYAHRGFSLAALAIFRDIRPHLQQDYTIDTTGHSLGGAVALLLAMHMDVENFKVRNVITFGQPKVTNFTGANKFSHLNIKRVVTEKDIVPLVPPFDPVDINNLDIYWHTGTEIILLKDNTYATLDGVNSMLRVTSFTQELLNERNLENHQMMFYLKMINKKLNKPVATPFKHNLNLFNLFGN